MKYILFIVINMFAFTTLAQTNTTEDTWFKFQTPITEAIEGQDSKDTPLISKDKNGTPTDYTVPVIFTAVSNPDISDIIIDIKQISTKYDKKGSLIIYLNGKVDLSCCYNGEMNIDFYDSDDNLVQKARTDEFGKFKLKSINGKMFTIKDNQIKFNFTSIKTFDLNADIRYATVASSKKPLKSEEATVEESTLAKESKDKGGK